MARNVVFVAPFPSEATMRFVRRAAKLDDVRLLGVVHTPPDEDVYADVVRVAEPSNLAHLVEAVDVLHRRHGPIHRIVGVLEAMMVLLAQVRERFEVPGTSVRTAELFRDKAQMKDALREAGLPVARHRLLASEADATAFAREIGFPMIVKPPAGMSAKSTFRVASLADLLVAMREMRARPGSPILAEEMLQGSEHSLETITVGGVQRAWSASDYLPACLEVLENPWIQWAVVLPREVDAPRYDLAREASQRAIQALGLEDGMTHMEWFQRRDGSIAIGEIAARPPGPQLCQMTGLANEVDIYRAWARAVVDGELDAPWPRTYAAGSAYLRGTGRGKVASVRGVRETHEAIKKWLVEARLPTIGASKNDSYEGDGYVVVRHPATDKVREMVKTIIETIEIGYAD